ncbi:hypothetical protein Zm00014a_037016 [Zea mays]|uniref:Uncharacterized protein n=1 Tax=Zea mays TaxID=4577 RepID=A0A3L6DLG2_MAIZE|nr:hypothetical protein Zm00014a_037016 [Zea mays]
MRHDVISRLGCSPLIASASSPTLSPRTTMTWDPCAASSCYPATPERKNQSSPRVRVGGFHGEPPLSPFLASVDGRNPWN